MNTHDALQIFEKILREYKAIKTPKYRNAKYEKIMAEYETLKSLKWHLRGNKIYEDLINSMSQIRAKLIKHKKLSDLTRDEIWSNYSERGMNKAIRPYTVKKNSKEVFPIEWVNQGKYKCYLSNGSWDENKFKVMDLCGYTLLMCIGGDRLPENLEPIFDNLKSIEEREIELNKDYIQRINSDDPAITTVIINKSTYSISIDDNHFRKGTGLKMSSKEIRDLLLETSRVEFKLHFPVLVSDNKGKETIHKMNYYSRFFELGAQDIMTRKDGIVQLRKYRINFTTILGELWVNNLISKYNDRVDLRFYNLPKAAQLFYRRFLLHNNFKAQNLNLETVTDGLGYQDKNKANLVKTITDNILGPLKEDQLISFYEITEGLKGIKFIVKRDDTCRRM